MATTFGRIGIETWGKENILEMAFQMIERVEIVEGIENQNSTIVEFSPLN